MKKVYSMTLSLLQEVILVTGNKAQIQPGSCFEYLWKPLRVLMATKIYLMQCLGHVHTKEVPSIDLKFRSNWATYILSGKLTLRKQTHSLLQNLEVSWIHLGP